MSLDERDPALPDVPTWKELGVPVVTWGSIKGVAAPYAKWLEVAENDYGKLVGKSGNPT